MGRREVPLSLFLVSIYLGKLVDKHTHYSARVGIRRQLRASVSPSTVWGSEIIRLDGGRLYPWSHLAGPKFLFLDRAAKEKESRAKPILDSPSFEIGKNAIPDSRGTKGHPPEILPI